MTALYRRGTSHRWFASFALGFCLLGTAVGSQDSEAEAVNLGREGVLLLEAGQFASALKEFEAALAIWVRTAHLNGQAAVLGKMGEAHQGLGHGYDAATCYLAAGNLWRSLREYDLALQQYQRASEIQNEISDFSREGDTKSAIGEVYIAKGDYGWALEYLKTALVANQRIGNWEGLARTRADLGEVYTLLGRYREALENLDAAQKLESQDRGTQALILRALGVLYIRQGRYEEALQKLQGALAIAEKTGTSEDRGGVLDALGSAYFNLGRYSEALLRYEAAQDVLSKNELPQSRELIRGIRPLFASTLNDLGEVYLAQGNLASAHEAFTKALIALAVMPEDHVSIEAGTDRRMITLEALARYNLGLVRFAQGEHEAALSQYRGALTIEEDMGDQAGEGRTLHQMGRVYYALGRRKEAVEKYESALALQDKIGDRVSEIATLGDAAAVLRDEGHYVDVVAKLQRAVSFLEEVRGGLDIAENRMRFLSSRVQVVQDMVSVLAELARQPNAPAFALFGTGTDYSTAALHYAEQARARTWVESLARFPGTSLRLPGELAREEESLLERQRAALRAYREMAADADETRRKYQEVVLQFGQFIGRLRQHADRSVRAYAALKYPQPASADEILHQLRSEEVLLEYSVLRDETLLWILERDRPVKLVHIDVDARTLSEQVQEVRAALEHEFSVPETALATLYRKLLAPALVAIPRDKRLILIPDDVLLLLPFEALGQRSASRWKYVAEEWVLSYYPSATVLARMRETQERQTWERPLLAFGDPTYLKDSEFRPLGRSRNEVLRIGRLFDLEPGSADLKLGLEAREATLKEMSRRGELARYRYIHLAAHGLLASDAPEIGQPALVLAQVGDSTEDGFLTMAEILDLKLNPDLVVLSACQSGLGEQVPGEGVVGLVRAFFYAGARSAVVSLWDVSDTSAAQLMEHFYAHLTKTDADKAEALSQARRELMSAYSHPFHWAPFILIGEH